MYCHSALRSCRVDLRIKDVEYLCVKIALGHRRQIQVCCVYSPQKPTAGWKEAFYPMCNVLALDSSPCVQLADFNEDLLVDQCLAKGLASTFGLAQHITEVTRITAIHQCRSLITFTRLISSIFVPV